MVKLFENARKEKKYVARSILLALVFWLAQVGYHQFFSPQDYPNVAIVRGSAFTSATLLGVALLIGPLMRIFPSKNYIRHRRTMGVLGFTFGIVHFLAVTAYIFNFDVGQVIAIADPFLNPLIFGLIAFCIYMPLYVTSTDWAAQKLTYRRWKAIHRIVYIAWILTVLHFLRVNPPALLTAPGYLLLLVTVLVFSFELAAFARHTSKNRRLGTIIGLIIILFGAYVFYSAYTFDTGAGASLPAQILLTLVSLVIVGFFVISAAYLLRRKKAPGQPQQPAAQKQI